MKSRSALRSRLRAIAATSALIAAAGALAGEVTLKSAWLRPAAAGMVEAQAYVDIVSEADLELVGASTPFAKKVELVLVAMNNEPPEPKVVATLPVPAGKTTRLAYRGSHLRLVEITKSFGNGSTVPLTLAFKSRDGKDVSATVDAEVRGLLLPQQMPALTPKDRAPAPKAAAPAEAR
jgi:periplasmic copper chaperone A